MADSFFSNNQIETASLPAIQNIALEPVSARYRMLNLCVCSSVTVAILLMLGLLLYQPIVRLPEDVRVLLPLLMILTGGVGGARFVYHLIADSKVRFALRENDLVLEQGLFFSTLLCQPILRIQHVELSRGLLQRWAGLASLKVYSAGGAGHTFEIPGLERDVAQKLRHFIVHHSALDAK
ncbi:PH domain-containing protein [Salinimonas lutimaris]|uniref:PH domain-containing protein n=1 Tax=Salinimonas lutimaris TaxID=914153 RepID=UPI0010C117A9|nr:PH domain-containing protein [Salinimonas lutimaris]